MKKNNMFKVILVFAFLICLTGCFENRLNKNYYYLNDILLGNSWRRVGNSYITNDLSGMKYELYFDEADYMKNYFLYDNGEILYTYYYVEDTTEISCINKTNNVCKQNDDLNSNMSFIFETVISPLKLAREDLYIISRDVDTTIINVNK